MTAQQHSDHAEFWQLRFDDALDGALDAKALSDLEAQLHACPLCRDEFAKLRALHARLAEEFKSPPILGSGFDAALMARIDEQEHTRRAAAKLRAEQQFQERMRAFGWNWREFSERHFGSLIAGLTVVVAMFATFGSLWALFRERSTEIVASVPWLHGLTSTPVAAIFGAFCISAVSLWILRTKAR